MVRNYRRKMSNSRNGKNYKPYFSYSEDNLAKALSEIRKGSLSIREASEKYIVPKSTLGRKLLRQNMQQKHSGRPSYFTAEEETIFLQNLNLVS